MLFDLREAQHSCAHRGADIRSPSSEHGGRAAGHFLAARCKWLDGVPRAEARQRKHEGQRVRTLPQCQRPTSSSGAFASPGPPLPRREATNASWPSRLGLDLRPARRRHWRPAVFRRLPIGPTAYARPGGWLRTGPPTVPGAGRPQRGPFCLAADAKAGCLLSRRRRRPASPPKNRGRMPDASPPTSSPEDFYRRRGAQRSPRQAATDRRPRPLVPLARDATHPASQLQIENCAHVVGN